MNNSDLTNLGKPAPDLSQLPVVEGTAAQVEITVTEVTQSVTNELQKDSVTVSNELAPILKMVPTPSSPVELPAPSSGPPPAGTPTPENKPSVSSSPTHIIADTTDSTIPLNSQEGEIPQDQPQPIRAQPHATLDLTTQQGPPVSPVIIGHNPIAVPEGINNQSRSPGHAATPVQAKETAERTIPLEMNHEQVEFVLAKVLSSISQNPTLAHNPEAQAATRKALENFLSNTVEMVDKEEPKGTENKKYFNNLGSLLALMVMTSFDPSIESHAHSSSAAAVAVALVMKSLKDGSELMALLMGAMMLANTVPYAAANETLQDQKVDQNLLTLEFAKKYAERIIKLTSDPAYSGYLKELVMIHNAGAPTAQRVDQWVSVLKVGLLLTAVALLYQVEMGGGTAEEVIGCLRPNQEIKDNDLKAPLLKQIKGNLEILPSADREAVLLAMMDYLDSKPDLKSITDPIKVMQGMKMTGAFVPGQIQLASGA